MNTTATETQEVTITVPKPPKGWVIEQGRIPKVGEKAMQFSHKSGDWCSEFTHDERKYIVTKHMLFAFPAPKRKRLLTPSELAGKWLHHPLGDSFFVVRFCEGFIWMGDHEGGKSVKEAHDDGIFYSLTPTSERLPLEIEDDQ